MSEGFVTATCLYVITKIGTMGKVFLMTLLVSQLVAVGASSSERAFIPFDKSEYGEDYQISICEFGHGKVLISLIQARVKIPSAKEPHYCRAWLIVKRGDKNVFERYYADIDPVGSSFGLSVLENQLPSPYFAVVKQGDYDGHLFLVDREGTVTDLKSEFLFLTKYKRYLFSVYSEDLSSLQVLDLKKQELVLAREDLPSIHQWYFKDGTYFFTESIWTTSDGKPREKTSVAYFIDLKEKQILKRSLQPEQLATATRVDYLFDPGQYPNCTCSSSKQSNRD